MVGWPGGKTWRYQEEGAWVVEVLVRGVMVGRGGRV
jgi:hypothetical protein